MTVRDDYRAATAALRKTLGDAEPHLRWLLGETERHLDLAEPPVPARPDGRASAATWREHATALGVAVPDEASKADIVAAVAAASTAGEPAPEAAAEETPTAPTTPAPAPPATDAATDPPVAPPAP